MSTQTAIEEQPGRGASTRLVTVADASRRLRRSVWTLKQDEDGIWCAHAWRGSSGGANGNGATPEEAVADLREAVQMVLDKDGGG